MSAAPDDRDLEHLAPPAGQTITAGGEAIHVAPAKIGTLAKMLVAARPLIDAVRGSDAGLTAVQMLALHPQAVLEVAALAIDKPVAWVEDLPPDEAIALIGAVAQENRDFFMQRVLPRLTTIAASLGNAGPIPGPTPSTH